MERNQASERARVAYAKALGQEAPGLKKKVQADQVSPGSQWSKDSVSLSNGCRPFGKRS